jgi:hypothetical protein
MATTPDRTPVEQRRQAVDTARSVRLQAEADLASQNAALAQLQRTIATDDPRLREAQVQQRRAAAAVAAARGHEGEAQSAVTAAVGAWLGDDPTAHIAALDTDCPITLMPVRLETRFFIDASELRVRVYPDEISADPHEPELAPKEQSDGAAYWTVAQAAGHEDHNAWRALLQIYPPGRAAWIVRTTQPNMPPPASHHKPAGWSRAVEARLLPDRWIVVGYRNQREVVRAYGDPIVEPLALSVGPDTPESERTDFSGDKLMLDDAVRWTVDWDRAVSVGMGIRVPLQAIDLQLGFERLLVFGVKASMAPHDTAGRLSALLDAHHYTRGLAFVPQGSPTSTSRAKFPPTDPNGSKSFTIERDGTLGQDPGSAGPQLARAFGISADVMAHIDGTQLSEAATASAMNCALFPAALGYFFDQMISPLLTPVQVDAIGRHFVNWVAPRGPLSALRVGRVPYGVLPVTSLTLWQSAVDATPFDIALPERLRTLRDVWQQHLDEVPRVGRSNDPDQDLLDVLSMDASAREVRVRRVVGEEAYANLVNLFGIDFSAWAAVLKDIAIQTLNRIGVDPDADPRVVHLTLHPNALRYHGELVDTPPLSETAPLVNNYIDWIRTASVFTLRAETLPAGWPDTIKSLLLYRFLRHAALAESHRWAVALLAAYPATPVTGGQRTTAGPLAGPTPLAPWKEHELVGIVPGTEGRATPWRRFLSPVSVPGVGLVTVGDFLAGDHEGLRRITGVPSYRDALARLSPLPTAELERLFAESLDASSHRLDAWITSLATQRLAAIRNRDDRLLGCFAGSYGWAEDLRPVDAAKVTLPDGRVARTSSGGYVHAPSMTHAMTAAVLRNGYLAHLSDTASPYAIDLSSAQVRIGRFVLDSVRNGQQIGAVLGYQIERALHERRTESLIELIRNAAPLVANKALDSGEPAELVAARNVVDGLLLRDKWKNGTLYGTPTGLPANIPHRGVLEQELAKLDRTVDAVADMLLAESVHQVVRGSMMASSAGLDAMAQGVRPPEPDVVHAATGGLTLTHRLAIVFDGQPLSLPPGWAAAPTPRAAAEPRIDAWVGALLGDATTVRCRVTYPDVDANKPAHEVEVTLDELRLRPLDMLVLARAVVTQPGASELDRRVLNAAFGDTLPGDAAPAGPFSVIYEPLPSWNRAQVRSVPELLDRANAIGAVLGGMRPLVPVDLVLPEQASNAEVSVFQVAELQGRVTAAHDLLLDVQGKLQTAVGAVPATKPPTRPTPAQAAAIRTQLRRAAEFGLPTSFPPFVAGGQEGNAAPMTLVDIANSVLADIAGRLSQYDNTAPTVAEAQRVLVQKLTLQAQALFGRDFIILPGFAWPNVAARDELAQALAYGPTLIGADARAVDRWLQQAVRLREPLGRWRVMCLLGEASGVKPAGWDVAQLPHVVGASWMALPPLASEKRASGRVSLVLHRPSSPKPDATQPWFGLFLDEWVEMIPNASEHTGISFRYEHTGGEAAQAILIAVPPTNDGAWSFEALAATLNETFDLAKLRAIDAEFLPDLGQLVPGVYLAANAADETISTRFLEVVDESKIIPAVEGGGD